MIDIQIQNSPKEVAEAAARTIVDAIREKPSLVLGLATGGSVMMLYQKLIEHSQRGEVDFSEVVTFNLDEYVGLPRDHEQTYYSFMHTNLFTRLEIPPKNIHILHGMAEDLTAECLNFEQRIKDVGGIDLQVLGIGRNGHIAFNEPGSPADSRTRLVDLTQDTIAANSDGRFFSDASEVPRQALTMGIGTILDSRKTLLLATGAGKAEAVALAIRGPITEHVPASFLQRHPKCTFIIDRDAASQLGKT